KSSAMFLTTPPLHRTGGSRRRRRLSYSRPLTFCALFFGLAQPGGTPRAPCSIQHIAHSATSYIRAHTAMNPITAMLPSINGSAATVILGKLTMGELADQAPGGEVESADWSGSHRYAVVRRIGQGGMGVVYEVRDRQGREPLALKTLLRFTPAD